MKTERGIMLNPPKKEILYYRNFSITKIVIFMHTNITMFISQWSEYVHGYYNFYFPVVWVCKERDLLWVLWRWSCEQTGCAAGDLGPCSCSDSSGGRRCHWLGCHALEGWWQSGSGCREGHPDLLHPRWPQSALSCPLLSPLAGGDKLLVCEEICNGGYATVCEKNISESAYYSISIYTE